MDFSPLRKGYFYGDNFPKHLFHFKYFVNVFDILMTEVLMIPFVIHRIAVVYGIFAGETGAYIERSELTRFLLDTDGPTLPSSLSHLFSEGKVWGVPSSCL